MSDEFSLADALPEPSSAKPSACQEHRLFHGALCHQDPGDHQHHILALQDHIPRQDPILLRIILTKCLQDLLVLHQCLVAPILDRFRKAAVFDSANCTAAEDGLSISSFELWGDVGQLATSCALYRIHKTVSTGRRRKRCNILPSSQRSTCCVRITKVMDI
ncbi:hypothetical protein NN561_011123 [Cricetulus griseus]